MNDSEAGFQTRMRRALLAFLRSQTAGGLALIAASGLALIWSNDTGAAVYFRALAHPVWILPVDGWVNDGLMTLFFLTVGLEIRRELMQGSASLVAPALAAVGGMVMPALIYAGLNVADPVRLRGWAVPVATDIAFALAALSVLGRRVPIALKVFLTTLAIIDDLGAIVIIAVFYTARLDWIALAGAAGVCGGLFGLNRAGVRFVVVYLAGGLVLWALVLRSGVHPTIAGVALAFVVPMDDTGHRIERGLGSWVTWVVLPMFGLANAGLRLGGVSWAAFTTPAVMGTALGLMIGKPLGVFGATWLAVRSGVARLPVGLRWSQLFGASVLCGIGFTMSLFIADLGFHGNPLQDELKLAVFTGSAVSAVLGIVILGVVRRRRGL